RGKHPMVSPNASCNLGFVFLNRRFAGPAKGGTGARQSRNQKVTMLQHCRTENLIVGKDFAAQRQRSEITKRRAAPITAYALTYNEAPQIRDALESIKWADEIIIVDSFSTDGT